MALELWWVFLFDELQRFDYGREPSPYTALWGPWR